MKNTIFNPRFKNSVDFWISKLSGMFSWTIHVLFNILKELKNVFSYQNVQIKFNQTKLKIYKVNYKKLIIAIIVV